MKRLFNKLKFEKRKQALRNDASLKLPEPRKEKVQCGKSELELNILDEEYYDKHREVVKNRIKACKGMTFEEYKETFYSNK